MSFSPPPSGAPGRRALRLAVLLAAVALGPLGAQAAPDFTPEEAVLLATGTVHAVVSSTQGYRLYFSTEPYSILSATSADQGRWSVESGVRLSTQSAVDLDGSSITSCGVLPSTNPASGYRLFYVGISTAGFYSVLSATSADGLSWTKEGATRLRSNGGRGYLASPAPITVSASLMRLFYVADSAGGNTPSAYRVHSASSTDGGLTFTEEGIALSDVAYSVAVTTLTSGITRLYYTSPVSPSTTAARVLSASASNGLSFSAESGTRLSTSASTASLGSLALARSTESFRWRLFASYFPAGSTTPYAAAALTLSPAPKTLTPAVALRSASTVSFTLAGEVFASSPSVYFTQGASSFSAFSLSRVSDVELTGSFNPAGQARGFWTLVVVNTGTFNASLANALYIDVNSGSVSILDNVFRPMRGQRATITATVYDAGRLKLDVYTIQGARVATLLDRDVTEGSWLAAWDGKTSLGSVVASGVYLLKATGPKLNTVEKMVVIK